MGAVPERGIGAPARIPRGAPLHGTVLYCTVLYCHRLLVGPLARASKVQLSGERERLPLGLLLPDEAASVPGTIVVPGTITFPFAPGVGFGGFTGAGPSMDADLTQEGTSFRRRRRFRR